MKTSKKLLLLGAALVLFCAASFGSGQTESQAIVLTTDRLANGKAFDLGNLKWKFHPGNDPAWARADFNDTDWETVSPSNMRSGNLPASGWRNGEGWFRLQIEVDEAVARQSAALRLTHYGASEIYLDGKLIGRWGEIQDGDDVETNPQGAPLLFQFESAGQHTIAVHYSFKQFNHSSPNTETWLRRGNFAPGFNAGLQTAPAAMKNALSREAAFNDYKLYAGILGALAFLHFWLFIFYRQAPANLYYSFFAATMAGGATFASPYNNYRGSAFVAAVLFVLFVVSYSVSFLALLTFLYVAFAKKFSVIFWLLTFYLLILVGVMAIYSRADFTLYIVIGFMIAAIADAVRIMIKALCDKRDGAWIIMSGVLLFAGGVLIWLSFELGLIQARNGFEQVRQIGLYLALPIAVSIYLARNFARTNRDLAKQLETIEQLSARQLEHERRESDLRIEREKERSRLLIAEAENDRRAQELEEARQLQLSLLPKRSPNLPNLEIAAYMKPASEVGGDYYDFHISPDNTLTVAVGDATGHGLKAGTVVTAAKTLFTNLAAESDIRQIFKLSSATLKRLNLRGLFMAMAMLKIKDDRLTICLAGMPPLLIFRRASNAVETIKIPALPLGSLANIVYEMQELNLSTGDTVVLMSDGFPEMFNQAGEMLGYEKAQDILAETSNLSAQNIIDRFVRVGEDWAGGRAQDDDVTFVVLKVK